MARERLSDRVLGSASAGVLGRHPKAVLTLVMLVLLLLTGDTAAAFELEGTSVADVSMGP